jgi:hypothetical protein
LSCCGGNWAPVVVQSGDPSWACVGMLGVGNPAVSSRYESGAPRWRPGSGNNNSSSSGAVAPRAGRASPARSLAQRGATLVLARLGKVVSPRVLQAAERTTPGDEGTGGDAKRRVCCWPVARVWPHGSCVPFFGAAPNQTPITTAPAITTKAAGHKAPRPAPLAAGGTSRVPWRAESPATAGHVGGAAVGPAGGPRAAGRKRPRQPAAAPIRRAEGMGSFRARCRWSG